LSPGGNSNREKLLADDDHGLAVQRRREYESLHASGVRICTIGPLHHTCNERDSDFLSFAQMLGYSSG